MNVKKKEIENICNFHYQEFIHSVDELTQVHIFLTESFEENKLIHVFFQYGHLTGAYSNRAVESGYDLLQ